MLQLLIYFFIGIALSMDAFSLSISLGTTKLEKKYFILLPIVIGIFHYIMPSLGSIVGSLFNNKIFINTNYIISTIFLILTISMYKNRNNNESIKVINYLSIILLAISVSIDSFSVGIALGITRVNIYLISIIFSILSFIFTFIGLILGMKMKEKYGQTATIIGIIIMGFMSLKFLIFT